MEKRELVIIGAGPAGLSAAIYGKRAGLDTLVLEKGRPGGQVLITSKIENYPGILDGTGSGLADAFRTHAEHFKAEFRTASVQKLEVRDGEKIITLKDGSEIAAGAVIVASGASFRKQGCPGESTYTGMGVSYCAVCDAAFFEDLEVAVIGGGNTAVEEACYLTGFASKVYIVHRRDEFRADRLVVEHALANPKIVPVMDSVLESIEGSDMVEKIVVRNVKTEEKREIPLSGVFIFIGTLPNDEYLHGLLQTDAAGWIITDSKLQTSVPGIFAAGDVRNTSLRQVVTAAGDGARAAMSAYAIAPKKRPLSSMTPTIVLKNDKPWLVTGSPGGARIITTVLQSIVNTIDHGMNPAEAIVTPRVHHQWLPDELRVEDGISPDTIALLQQKGHKVALKAPMGRVQIIQADESGFYGYSDPRNPDGKTLGY